MTSENNTPEAELDAALDALVNQADAEVSDAGEAATADETSAGETSTGETSTGEVVTGETAADEAPAADQTAADEAGEDPYAAFKLELRTKPGKWYVVHSYAGYERKVKSNLWNRRETMGAVDDIFEIQVPMEEVMEVKNGQRKMVTRVRVPGYVLVRMNLNENSWSVVRHTPGVTGFVGNAHNPVPLRFNEAFEMLKSTVELEPVLAKSKAAAGAAEVGNVEIDFEIGETITIKSGPLEGLPGTISEINPAAGKLTVLVSLFERETPVELSFDQVTKMV
ncbi:MAG: transcription termination/antitermination protein NusG [Actinobacteria bacterium]|nr:transcription termination/antitermination protein NusG [Actinomycetota bacterium]